MKYMLRIYLYIILQHSIFKMMRLMMAMTLKTSRCSFQPGWESFTQTFLLRLSLRSKCA